MLASCAVHRWSKNPAVDQQLWAATYVAARWHMEVCARGELALLCPCKTEQENLVMNQLAVFEKIVDHNASGPHP